MKVLCWFLNIKKNRDSSQDKKMKPTLAFLILLFHVGATLTFGRDRAQYVTWDEMNLMANGLLQLGRGLREHVEKANRQMSDVSAKLNAFNGTIGDLVRRIRSLQRGENAVKTRTQEMVERENRVVNMSAEVHARAEELMVEHQRIHSRMDRLEERVNGMLQGPEEGVKGMLQGPEERVKGMLQGPEERVKVMLQGPEERVKGMLQGPEKMVKGMLQGLEERVKGMLQGPEERVKGMPQGLELDLKNCSNDHSCTIFIQRLLEMQNRQIADMARRISQQQEQLLTQSIHLQALQVEVKENSLKLIVRQGHQKNDTKEVASPTESARDCQEWFQKGERLSGVYTIQPPHTLPFDVFCEMTVDAGWTVIQRRRDGSQNFDQSWEAYKNGFGGLTGEFWLGLENIHTLSKQEEYTLAVELSDWRGEAQSVQLPFRLGAEESNYTLYLPMSSSGGLESGIATGSFSTTDRDNDLSDNMNCAKQLSGGWWFSNCGQSNLNGKFSRNTHLLQSRRQLLFWKTNHALRTTVMKIAPATIRS